MLEFLTEAAPTLAEAEMTENSRVASTQDSST